MTQIALPLGKGLGNGPRRIVVGTSNSHIVDALSAPESWPFRTAVLVGPPRSGKSLIAGWFAEMGKGEAIDNADAIEEITLFHRWNRAQESGTPLLLVAQRQDWAISLPDLKSRLGAALHLEIGPPDDAMVVQLIEAHGEQRDLPIGGNAAAYLAPRTGRTYAEIEQLVAMVDLLSLERKQAPTLAIWRAALEAVQGSAQPRLL